MDNWIYQNAYFTDVNRTVINIEWLDGDKVVEETIPFDTEFHRYQALLDHVSLDQLHENTKQRNREGTAAFKEVIKQIAEEDGYLYLDEAKGYNASFDKVNEYLFGDAFNEETDKELLFKLKLSAFEMEFVKSFKDRALKSQLRKAESVYKLYSILFKIKDAVSD